MSDTLSPKTLVKNANNAFKQGDYLLAAQTFKAAQTAYEIQEDNLNAAEMANNCSVAYLQADLPEESLQAVEGTIEVFEQAGDTARHGMALGNYGAALEALGRGEEAIEAYLESARLLEQAGEDQLRAKVLQSLSTLQFQEGRQLEALASMQSGLEGVKKPSTKQRFLKRLLNIPFDMINKKTS